MIAGDQSDVVDFLGDPRTHGGAVERIDTHGAMVFLAADVVYKLKRAVKFPYMDFSTLELRLDACRAEIEVNSRTAPTIYKGIAAILRGPDGALRIGDIGEDTPKGETVLDWVVVMARFDQDGMFDRLAAHGALDAGLMADLARTIAAFHASAAPRQDHGGSEAMAWVVDQNLKALDHDSPAIFDGDINRRLRRLSEAALKLGAQLLDRRRGQGWVRHCHGDMHLRNICLIDAKPTLFDAIEFNQAIACVDVLYDLAFLLMDLERRGLRGLANGFFNHYLASGGDGVGQWESHLEGLGLLPLFLACRALVRAQTSAAARDRQSDPAQARRLETEARDHQALALELLAPPPPRLVAIGGLSGVGKSTLARALAPAIGAVPGAVVLRSDVIRKKLCGADMLDRLGPEGYSGAVTDQTFGAIYALAGTGLDAGHGVIADAVFAKREQRRRIEQVAARIKVPFTGIWLHAPTEVMEQRLRARPPDASDATPGVLRQQLDYDLGQITWHRIEAAGTLDATLAAVRAHLG